MLRFRPAVKGLSGASGCRQFSSRESIAVMSMSVVWSMVMCLPPSILPLTVNADASERPNLVLIMADDLGYETLGVNGGTSYRTPNLDKLASTGARFNHCYVQPLCTPTRIQLMTGQYNVRNYVRFGYIDPKLTTFGQLMQRAGYATGIAGKWQLGQEPDLPQRLGFAESCLWQHTRRPARYANPGLEYNGVEKDFTNGEYGPDLVNDFALDFIARHADEKFFLYYPMMLTHSPYQPTPDSPDWDPKTTGENANKAEKHFGEMVEYMDKLIGKLVVKLEALKIRDNTLILFVGDNGTGKGTVSMMGERRVVGGKGTMTSEGMHVPLIANWPKQIHAGIVSNDLVDSTDFLPTLLEAAGVEPVGTVDGRSFLPSARGGGGEGARPWIYSWYSPRMADDTKVREMAFNRDYKLFKNGKFFDLKNDPSEEKPLKLNELNAEQTVAAKLLQSAIDGFADARPTELDDDANSSTKAKKGNKKKKREADAA